MRTIQNFYALLSHPQLVAGVVAHILRSAYIFGKRSSSHSLRALAAVFGLSSFGFEEYLKEIKKQYVLLLFNKLSLCPDMVRKPSISVIRT